MSDEKSSSKSTSVDLRIVLIGDVGVGKKSMIQRFKILNCTETKTVSGFIQKKKKKKTEKSPSKKEKKSPDKKTNTNSQTNNDSQEEEETQEEKLAKRREEKRIDLMGFSKFYQLGLHTLDISFYACAEEQPLPYDYEPKEEDEFYEYEKEYHMSIKMMIKELEFIFMRPPETEKTQVEILLLLIFDLSNLVSFEKLVVFFSQIHKHFSKSIDYKLIFIGNKMDKKSKIDDETKNNIEKFKSQFGLTYFEISTSMFFNFERFFEKLILDNYSYLPIFEEYQNKFHEILNTKPDIPQTKRPPFAGNDVPGSNQYNTNPYQYPENQKEFLKMFKDKNKYNKYIFVNKSGMAFPPIKNNDKDYRLAGSPNKKNNSQNKKQKINVMYSYEQQMKNEKIQKTLELSSRKNGYSLGTKTYKPLGLASEREKLRQLREKERMEALGNVVELGKKVNYNGNKGTLSQDRYAMNRLESHKRRLEELKNRKDDLNERHSEMNEKNNKIIYDKILAIQEKENKYTKLFEEKEKNKERLQNEYYVINNSPIKVKKSFEPKKPFYDVLSRISPNKGFTFGMKYPTKITKVDSPEFPTFQDDFEKLVEKNKKRITIKPIHSKYPTVKTNEVGDSSYIMDKQKDFEERRKDRRKNLMNDFFEDRKYKREDVYQKKKQILEKQQQDLQSQIQKTYKNDENYLIREINYDQVEHSSPKFSMFGRYEHGSIFQSDKKEKDVDDYEINENENKSSNRPLENPDFNLIRPRVPTFKFGFSQRFIASTDYNTPNDNSDIQTKSNTINNKNETEANNINNNDILQYTDPYYCYKDTKSFLNAQTTMGTEPRLHKKDNGNPGPGMYKIKGFADKITDQGEEVNKIRIKLKEKAKIEEMEKQRREKLREERFNEKRMNMKISLKDSLNLGNNKDEISVQNNSDQANNIEKNENENKNNEDGNSENEN